MAAIAESVENDAVPSPENENLTRDETSHSAVLNGNPSANAESGQQDENLAARTAEGAVSGIDGSAEKWPGWPGDCVFRLIVPVTKVGAIIGRKGDIIKKMSEETGARIKVLDGPITTHDRVVLISGKEEPEASLSPAMDAALRVFRRVSGLPDDDDNDDVKTAGVGFCSLRLLVGSSQAINLIGKQGSLIKSIVENSGAFVRVLPEEDNPFYASEDERIVELQGEGSKVLKALEAVVGQLRKFLVHHTVVPLFEKQYLARASQGRQSEMLVNKPSLRSSSQSMIESDFSLLARREPLFLEPESRIQPPGVSICSQDRVLSARHSPGLGRVSTASFVTQVAQTMQIPFSYAEDIIGVEGANIAYIRRISGATISIQESPHRDEITVEIKGTSTQVQIAQQQIEEFISNHKETVTGGYDRSETGYLPTYPQLSSRNEPLSSGYSETGYRPTYSQLSGSSYMPSGSGSGSGQTYGSEHRASSDVGGGYTNFKL
ncbi:PREDICTED: RNA-binding KH domain-containing protein PEPPER-like [Tarenaya hassleriana]|uniref:RNA-binding KH domain-containing protein PEPPER-like n=1 Tax=Tarenaya hassleriana TaxID=28532 RepID=UPI0008FCFE08|nr:PREDICTED: RNA-binding KH domain-containing protein PEPPER-like [Tarenaya hassleriana]